MWGIPSGCVGACKGPEGVIGRYRDTLYGFGFGIFVFRGLG